MKTKNLTGKRTGKHSKPIKTLIFTSVLSTALTTTLVACGGDGDGSNNSGNNTNNSSTNTNSQNSSNQNTNSNTTNSPLDINANIAKNFVDTLATPALSTFAIESEALPTVIQAYCSNIDAGLDSSERVNAQTEWTTLKNQWQATKIYHVGVLTDNHSKLAKNIYTSNFLQTGTITAINNQVALYKTNNNLVISDKTAFNVRGLDALEHLLFNDTVNNKDSCSYAVLIAENIAENAKSIEQSWTADRNNLLTTATSNGVDLVQPFFDNVVTILDKDIKDASLGIPLGVKVGGSCGSICVDKLEHPVSTTSYDSIKANLQSIKNTFNTNGSGFKTYYDNNKMTGEAALFAEKINTAINTIDTQSTSLYAQLKQIKESNKENACTTVATTGNTNDPELAPCKLYYQIKQLSDEVKTGSFKLAVNLDLPASAAGDGD